MYDHRVTEAQRQIDEEAELAEMAETARQELFDDYVRMFQHEIESRNTLNIIRIYENLGVEYMDIMEQRLAQLSENLMTYHDDDMIMTMWLHENDLTKIKCALQDIIDVSPLFEDKVAERVTLARRNA